MNSLDSQIRWLFTAVSVVAAALVLVAPVGAWEDPEGGRQAGNGQGSMPTQLDQSSADSTASGRSFSAESYLQHTRAEQLAAPTSNPSSGGVVAPMNPGVIVSNGKTFVPGVTASGQSALIEVGPNLRVLEQASGVVVATMNPGVVVSNGKTFVPGVTANGESTLIEVGPNLQVVETATADAYIPGYTDSSSGIAAKLGKDLVPAVPQATVSTSSDDGIEVGPISIALASSLAVAALMALMALTVRRRRNVILH